jgi:hypothetical protein
MNEINKRKFTKSYSRIIIKAPICTFEKVSELCKEISKSKYYLEKIPQTEGNPDTVVELILVENGKNETMKFYGMYHTIPEEKEKGNGKRYQSTQEEKVKPPSRVLGSSY